MIELIKETLLNNDQKDSAELNEKRQKLTLAFNF
jgi:hypothetical protein